MVWYLHGIFGDMILEMCGETKMSVIMKFEQIDFFIFWQSYLADLTEFD